MDAETLRISNEKLLIVDDDPLMTELFQKYMSKHEFDVATAASAVQALKIVEAEQSGIRLVLTDMTMPTMDGLSLARELGHRHPALPVILATGHDVGMEAANDLPNVVAVVRKPYQNRALAALIRQILQHGRAES